MSKKLNRKAALAMGMMKIKTTLNGAPVEAWKSEEPAVLYFAWNPCRFRDQAHVLVKHCIKKHGDEFKERYIEYLDIVCGFPSLNIGGFEVISHDIVFAKARQIVGAALMALDAFEGGER